MYVILSPGEGKFIYDKVVTLALPLIKKARGSKTTTPGRFF